MADIGWRYYNHALIPNCAPHEVPDVSALDDRELWKNGKPLLARWTTDFDCGVETDWWYIVCMPPFSLEALPKSSRKSVRKALEYCSVKKIDPAVYAEEIWRVYNEAIKRYKGNVINTDKNRFIEKCRNVSHRQEYWAGFDKSTNRIIGYKICTVHDQYVDFSVSKYSADYLKLRVSDALNYTVLDHYLNIQKKKYVSNGERSIVHQTNVQGYYQEHFHFRKAYCHLNVLYRKGFGLLVCFLYPFRRVISTESALGIRMTGVFKMEEICRKQGKHDN